MIRFPRYGRILSVLCVSFICFTILNIIANLFNENKKNETFNTHLERRQETVDDFTIMLKRRSFTEEQINSMTMLGRWLLSSEESSPPPIINPKKEPYLILIWKYGKFLERRHIKRFTRNKFSPWNNCTVKNCLLTYQSKYINKADAVVFHLHLTKAKSELPVRKRWDQRWIFLSDESPMHTFLYGPQTLSEYNDLFNWTMTYRMDSDVPIPYGRMIYASQVNSQHTNFSENTLRTLKNKLVAVLSSNCASENERWSYINELKLILGNDLDIYGKCLNANATACPGHFDTDCPTLNAYKFYLAFENSNCKEYITEKVFWHGYHKLTVPIIMGTPKKDCERLLPPYSFIHVSDFASPTALANYIRYLNHHIDEYFKYHVWRKYYRVINEHGYFQSISKHYCRICEALHYNLPTVKVYENIESFWNKTEDCSL